METSPPEGSPPFTEAKTRIGQSSDAMDVDATTRDRGPYTSHGQAIGARDTSTSQQRSVEYATEVVPQLPTHGVEVVMNRESAGVPTRSPPNNGQPLGGIASATSFGNSASGQQQVPIRGQTYIGGKLQETQSSGITTSTDPKPRTLQQKLPLSAGLDTRISPMAGNSLDMKTGMSAYNGVSQSSSEKTQKSISLISRTGSDPAHVYIGTTPQTSGSASLNKPQSVNNDLKAQVIAHGSPMLSVLQSGPTGNASAGKSRDTSSFVPLGQQSSSQKNKQSETIFTASPNVPRRPPGQVSRVPPVAQSANVGTQLLGGRPLISTNRPGPELAKMQSSTPPSASSDKSKRSSPNDPSIPGPHRVGVPNAPSATFNNPNNPVGVVNPQQHQLLQGHQQNRPGPPGRRPLPMAGSQPPQILSSGGGGPSPSQQQNHISPAHMNSSVPSGVMQYRGSMDDGQHPPRQQPPQAHAPQNPAMHQPAQAPNGSMRELRVEDALLYLDDVKREFKDRPAIYNEFLTIMKNFKSQQVDTPGVIFQVSKLFRGYNNLILGFNTFLPDGYKISLADLERQDAELREAAREAAEKKKAAKAPGPKAAPKSRKPAVTSRPGPVPMQQVSAPPQPSSLQPSSLQPSSLQPPGVPMQQLQVPPRQHPPTGFRGRPDDSLPLQSPPSASPHPPIQTFPTPARPSVSPPHGPSPPLTQSTGSTQRPIVQSTQPAAPPQPTQTQTPQPPLPQHQAVEFDHAISYVTTIKKRFANDPGTYHQFLEILHTYQKEQRGIKEVLEQVAHLFQDHPDLLKEFTFFLPDAVQEQAKERLHRAAAESESRQAAQRQQMMEQYRVGGQPAQNQPGVTDVVRRPGQPVETDARVRKRQVDGQPVPIVTQPESFVYNSAVERQFFDSAREALSSFTRDGGQAWAEFLKCMDMYAQEILSRSEMLNFVEPLLGKRNNNLFEEFKRILTAAGASSASAALIEDSWYSVPLAEIDFSRCRRCSPSYRALPRDYPAHPCNERNETEVKVLNDVWVSLPVGSEESYTFRHMRRNTYEETLFRVEDERFEIDMAIDCNAATLHRLEPIAEEIAQLARADVMPTDLGLRNSDERTGLGGKRFQYTFDKSILGVIHRNAIARIFGDAGKEMLELLEKNPTVAVPLVLRRLRQKQHEWVKVRIRLNRHWKELAEHNYYKSLDHRSLTWRTIDKRAISTRTLIAEIKDRAANGGREGKESYRQKLEKAKEEHGTFYEVTVGSKLDQDLDLTFLPKPDRRLFTPHQSLLYNNVSWAQRDAYRILAFALERGSISPADKERCHRLWVEFLGPWFGLSLSWMQKPAVTYQESTTTSHKFVPAVEATVVSEDDEESLDEEANMTRNPVGTEEMQTLSGGSDFTDHHPLPAGACVSTLYGEGRILQFRKSDQLYKVKLGFHAIAFLRPSTVLCSMLPVENSAYTRELRAEDRTKLARPNDQLAFGTQSLYLFFRLHHILVQRLNIAKQLAYSVDQNESLQGMLECIPNSNPKAVGKLRYEAYLSLLYSLLDGGVGGAAEGGKYEDRVRCLLGHGAYELATMDKLISHIWKDIQTMANDENMWNLVQLFRRHSLAGSFQPEAFRQEAAYISDGEPMYAFQYCPVSDSDESVLHMEYVGVMDDEDDDPMDEEIEAAEQQTSKRQKR